MAAKCTLAARVDSFHESSEGKVGARVTNGVQLAGSGTDREVHGCPKQGLTCGDPPSPLPQVGYELKDEIERKFDKWQEPPPVKQVKPLPAPLDGQRKKRGGRR